MLLLIPEFLHHIHQQNATQFVSCSNKEHIAKHLRSPLSLTPDFLHRYIFLVHVPRSVFWAYLAFGLTPSSIGFSYMHTQNHYKLGRL